MPRWAFSLFWRRDGVPLWRDIGLIARAPAAQPPSVGDARRFAESIAARLGIIADFVQPAFEDPTDRMMKQGAVPVNIDPSDPKIDDLEERARILRVFESHVTQPVGLCYRCNAGSASKTGWLSEVWRMRRGQLFLTPGDSPLGLRLPLQSLPYIRARGFPASNVGRPVR